jgi:hypothetical protein
MACGTLDMRLYLVVEGAGVNLSHHVQTSRFRK